jgi:hypothetical protein
MRIKDFFNDFEVNPISPDPMHGPITQELIDYIRDRNEQKLQASIQQLGEKWLLHPKNKELRKEAA